MIALQKIGTIEKKLQPKPRPLWICILIDYCVKTLGSDFFIITIILCFVMLENDGVFFFIFFKKNID